MRSEVVMRQVHNWIAVVAVLAVTLLGAVAIQRASSDRDQVTRNSVVAACEQINTGRVQINAEFSRLDAVSQALQGALDVAQREKGQSVEDTIAYARLQAMVDNTIKPTPLTLSNCDRLFDR